MGVAASEFALVVMSALYFLVLVYFVHDAVRREDISSHEKTFWIMTMFLLNIFGIIGYILVKTWKYYRMGKGS
ncbi:MAG: hypothetical protein GXO66_06595 [Euryarchaeota archaeon]|nr:hypothetical protein [Euryarchaeota archaeon]